MWISIELEYLCEYVYMVSIYGYENTYDSSIAYIMYMTIVTVMNKFIMTITTKGSINNIYLYRRSTTPTTSTTMVIDNCH